jgi:hypothetical protein
MLIQVYRDKLSQLVLTHRLYAACVPCRRIVELNVEALIAAYGEAYRLDDLRKRLRCGECDRRTGDVRVARALPRDRERSERR